MLKHSYTIILLKMIHSIKRLIKRNIIEPVSVFAVKNMVRSDEELHRLWKYSHELIPDFSHHFTIPINNKEIEQRIRFLVIGETKFIKTDIGDIIDKEGKCTYADVGDSDGSVRILLRNIYDDDKLITLGINLQRTAVDRMMKIGLDAICADALTLHEHGKSYDIVSAFETLEHLPDPVGFLKGMQLITKHRLVISVPYVKSSRVALAYISKKWPPSVKSTIENTHIFELSPKDWEKIFLHTGWKIEREWKLLMYSPRSLSKVILQPYWRYISFEGFWFVALSKDDTYLRKYIVE